MGFAGGGYIVNLVQTKPNPKPHQHRVQVKMLGATGVNSSSTFNFIL